MAASGRTDERRRSAGRVVRARRAVVAACVALTLLGSALAAAPAVSADPRSPTPSAADVRRARAAATTAASALAAAEARRSTAASQLQVLADRLEGAVETWNAARAAAADAQASLDASRRDALAARVAADAAQDDVDRLAVASYQVGADLSGGLGEWAAVLNSAFTHEGIQGLADRTTSVSLVAADRRRDLDLARTLSLVALQKEAEADRAAADLGSREAAVRATADQVRTEQAAQAAQVARLVAERDAASATLAAARSRASTLAATRTAALARAAAEARARALAKARADALARERARQHTGALPDAGGSGSTSAWPDGRSVTASAQRLAALAWARTQFGKPYVAGNDGPDSYDCSGLTTAAYRTVGVALVQYSQTQFATGEKIPVARLQPGDLVFFGTDPTDWRTIHHVGIYAGGGIMVEAPHTGDVVKTMTIWQDELVPYGARP